MKNRPPKLICQQCGNDWLGGEAVARCSHCDQWSRGITREQFDQIDRFLAENIDRRE